MRMCEGMCGCVGGIEKGAGEGLKKGQGREGESGCVAREVR